MRIDSLESTRICESFIRKTVRSQFAHHWCRFCFSHRGDMATPAAVNPSGKSQFRCVLVSKKVRDWAKQGSVRHLNVFRNKREQSCGVITALSASIPLPPRSLYSTVLYFSLQMDVISILFTNMPWQKRDPSILGVCNTQQASFMLCFILVMQIRCWIDLHARRYVLWFDSVLFVSTQPNLLLHPCVFRSCCS